MDDTRASSITDKDEELPKGRSPHQYLYRFRSTTSLLCGYHELEKQEIFFPSPELLNDPAESLANFYWQGDKNDWREFFKQYLLRFLYSAYIAKDTRIFCKPSTINIISDTDIYKNIEKLFFNDNNINKCIERLSNKEEAIKKNQLKMYLYIAHIYALIYIIEREEGLASFLNNINIIDISLKFLDMIEGIDDTPPDIKTLQGNIIYEEVLKLFSQNAEMECIKKIDSVADGEKIEMLFFNYINHLQNSLHQISKLFLTKDDEVSDKIPFPDKYLNNIQKLISPTLGTACFMREENISNPSMWGYYGDSHKGVCLEFETIKNPNNEMRYLSLSHPEWKESRDFYFMEVGYTNEINTYNFFELYNKSSTFIKDGKYDEYFCFYPPVTKTKPWEHERELRLICSYPSWDDFTIEQKYRYDFRSLKSITFGINTPTKDKSEIILIVTKKCKEIDREDFEFYQTTQYISESGEIKLERMRFHPLPDELIKLIASAYDAGQ
ncbi:DUF2971 domain-containing protein [Serratia aquatilis]|uniref:DUF2971 domain-containing protein n=1 Tax=Serratia aquatilis TaxID=1737515 RepID=A0ABV6EF67_9GAMM